jgi:hypothetical protein
MLAAPGRAGDLIVDASGVASGFTDITQAMLASSPGDRILVLPGSYPAFHFSRGVEVIGIGADPSQVVVERVDYHPNIPPFNYHTALSNLTVCGSGAANGTSISGNELAAGTLVLDGVATCGGVYLRGGEGSFYLMVVDSRVEPGPGGGFLNAAFDFSGGVADFVGTRITAANASLAAGTPAGTALRIGEEATVRLSGSEVLGGDGTENGGSTALDDGGTAIGQGIGTVASVRLSGGTAVKGGRGGAQGMGGDGIEVGGMILSGDATVAGGTGGVGPGAAYGATLPTDLGYDPELIASPAKTFAAGPTFLLPGESVQLSVDPSLPNVLVLGSRALVPPPTPSGSPLVTSGFGASSPPTITAPQPGGDAVWSAPSRRGYFQLVFVDPTSGRLETSNPIAITIAR